MGIATWIDEEGIVARLRLIGGHPPPVKAAFDAVQQWRYRPAMRNGVAAPVWTEISVTFRLNPGVSPPVADPATGLVTI